MTELLWIKSHVDVLLGAEWGVEAMRTDDDGDYPFRAETSMCWVSVVEFHIPMVRVFAHAAYEVKPSAKLLREFNDIQHQCMSARVELVEGIVLVAQTISPIGLTQPVLVQAMDDVATVADNIGPLVAAMFGGRTPFTTEHDIDQEAS